MAHADSNELLAAALAQLGRERDPYDGYLKRDMMDVESVEPYSRERGAFTGPLPPIPTADDPYVLEEHPMNMSDQYEIYDDHEDGQRIKSRPIEKKEEILICPDGNPCPEPDTMSFLDSFLNKDVAGVPYTLPDQQIFYETGGKVHQMSKPIKDDYDLKRLMRSMRDRYRV